MMPPARKTATVGSAGRLLPGITARVVKPDGSLASEGEKGALIVTGPSMALGYLNNKTAYDIILSNRVQVRLLINGDAARTEETFVNGWVNTGDEVIIKDMEVFVVDRIKVDRNFILALTSQYDGHIRRSSKSEGSRWHQRNWKVIYFCTPM